MGLIYYISTKNVSLAILMLSSLLISMNTYNKYKFNLLLMTMMDNDNYYAMNIHNMRMKLRRLAKINRRNISINNTKLDAIKKKEIKKIFNSLKIIFNSLIGKNKVPSKLTKLALKAKKISTDLNKTTPKIVKKIAQKIKDVAKSQEKSTPKVVSKLSSTLGVKESFVPNNLLKNLLKEKKISVNDATRLQKLTPKSTLQLLKEREIKRIPQTKIVSPKIGFNDILIPSKTINNLLNDGYINKKEAYKLRRLTPKSILRLLKEREITNLKHVKEVSSKLVKNVLNRISKIYAPRILNKSIVSTPASRVYTPTSKSSSKLIKNVIKRISKIYAPKMNNKSKVSIPLSINISKVSSKSPGVSKTPSVSSSITLRK
jgi:hypothetical protein